MVMEKCLPTLFLSGDKEKHLANQVNEPLCFLFARLSKTRHVFGTGAPAAPDQEESSIVRPSSSHP